MRGANRFPTPPFDTAREQRIGLLLINLGTPDAPTPSAVRSYLFQFLHDWRIIEISRWLWCPILHAVILRRRPGKVARLYKSIWQPDGAPLLVITRRIGAKLEAALRGGGCFVQVAIGMRYGHPSIASAMDQLRRANCQKIVVLSLYPQYSCATTASGLDALFAELRRWRWLPEVRTVNSYYVHDGYIGALAESVTSAWSQRRPPQKLVISFHGTPEKFRSLGDPYYQQCQATAAALAKALRLTASQWVMTFQSQFGNDPWIKPATSDTLAAIARSGVTSVDVLCPGFAADCLETIEEIGQENRSVFLAAGGKSFHYIEALNDRETHIEALKNLVIDNLQGWT